MFEELASEVVSAVVPPSESRPQFDIARMKTVGSYIGVMAASGLVGFLLGKMT